MTRTHESRYFYGNKISEYGLEQGYLDYRTLANAFDAVLVNDITKLFYTDIGGEFNEPEQVNGYIDNSEQIDALQEKIDELDDQFFIADNPEDEEAAQEQIKELQEQIEELEREQDEQREIFQYYIISNNGVEILREYTNDPVYYLPAIDCYVWGVTHWGTGWDYVLTDCKLEIEG